MREYWLSPATRKRLIRSGFLTPDGMKLMDPDKERKRVAMVNKRISEAGRIIGIKEGHKKAKLLLETVWLQRQLVRLMKQDDKDSRRQ